MGRTLRAGQMDDLAEGNVIGGRYRIREKLGAGGMGAVWIAEHIELGKTVALKTMLPSVSANDQMRSRFVNEARAAASIGHPSIVEVFDLGFHGAYAFIAMEKLEGEELERRIERVGPLPVAEAVRIAADLSDAMGAAHELGIVHRDLKPANVFLTTRGRQRDLVKVLDFGIAKLAQSNSDVNTKTGAVFGSPLYMAPEQLQDSKGVDARTDVHAIGAILHAMLLGRPPFDAATLPELYYKLVSEVPRSLRETRPDVPEWLDNVILRTLAKRADARPANGRVLAALLESEGRVSELSTTGSTIDPYPDAEQSASTAARSAAHAASGALAPLYSTAPPARGSPQRWLWVGAGTVFVLLLGGGALVLLRAGSAVTPDAAATAPVEASAPALVPSPPPAASQATQLEPEPSALPSVPSVRPNVTPPTPRTPATPKKPPAASDPLHAPPALVPR